jgi:hypothetical protein
MKGKIIGVLVVMLLFASAFQAVGTINNHKNYVSTNSVNVIKLENSIKTIAAQGNQVEHFFDPYTPIDSNVAFDGPGNQKHPAVEQTDKGILITGYYDEDQDDLFWTYSDDYGQTFATPVPGNVSGDYPSIKLWAGESIFGTWVTDPLDYNGGLLYLAYSTDPTNTSSYLAYYWDFASLGWYGMIDADIACDNSGQDFEWGVSSYVMSTTYEDSPYINGPTCLIPHYSIPWYTYICWQEGFEGCMHSDVDIDPSTKMVYLVYDYYNETAGKWNLLVWTYPYEKRLNLASWEIFEIDGVGNLQNPSVAANNDKVIILAETDENTNQDIICFYTSTGIENITSSFVADTIDDETCPDTRNVQEDSFIGTFIMNGNIFCMQTDDGGENWNALMQINDNDGTVVSEYKTSDICNDGINCMWEENNEDTDIWIGGIRQQIKAPTWEVGDTWTYKTKVYIGASPNVTDDMVVNLKGELTHEVVDDTGDTYLVTGNMKGITGTVDNPGIIDMRVTRLSSLKYDLEIRKEDLSIISHDLTIKGIALLKIGPIPLPIPIQMQYYRGSTFDPTFKVLPFPLYNGKNGIFENSTLTTEWNTTAFWGLIKISSGFDDGGWVGDGPYTCIEDTIEVEAGAFDVFNISSVIDFGTDAHDYYYSNYAEEVANIVHGIYNIDFLTGATSFRIEFELKETNYTP